MTFTDLDADPAATLTAQQRLDRATLRARRALLRRRRPLAALLACVAVGAVLMSTAAPPTETVSVLVAARDLPAGATLKADDVVSVGFAAGTPPEHALDDVDTVTGRLLAAPVGAGEPLTALRLVGADLARSVPGRRAVPVRLPDPGMVGLLEVGDLIDLVATDPDGGQVTTVAAAVPVLALPDSDPGGSATTSGLPGSLLVVGLTPGEVAPVTSAALSSFVTYSWSDR